MILSLFVTFSGLVFAQGEQRLADNLAQHPEANTNGDGKETSSSMHRRRGLVSARNKMSERWG